MILLYSNTYGTHLVRVHIDSIDSALVWLNTNLLSKLIMSSAMLIDPDGLLIIARFVCDQNNKLEYRWRLSDDTRGVDASHQLN